MKWWLILPLIAAVLLLLSRLRLGGVVEWREHTLLIRVRVGLLRVRVWPMRNKKPGKKASKEAAGKKTVDKPAQPATGPLELLETWAPLACKAAGRLRRAIRIDLLELHLVVGGADPGDAALLYGGTNALLGMILPLFEHAFQVRKRRVTTAVDFDAAATHGTFLASFSLTVGQLAAFTFWFLPEAIRLLGRREQTAPSNEKEAINHGK